MIPFSTHTLIAGSTGSGKSTLEKMMLYSLTGVDSPGGLFALIDTKKVELYPFRLSPFCRFYVDSPGGVLPVLRSVNDIIDNRYRSMRKKGLTYTDSPPLYIFIDEYADLIYSDYRRGIETAFSRILSIGRAAGVRVVLCTQRPTRDILTGMIAANCDTRIGLHTVTAQESRNIIGIKGCEDLPAYGFGFLRSAGKIEKIKISPVPEWAMQQRFEDLKNLEKNIII